MPIRLHASSTGISRARHSDAMPAAMKTAPHDPTVQRLASQTPTGTEDDGQHRRFDAGDDRLDLRLPPVFDVQPGQAGGNQHRGQDERRAGDHQPRPATAHEADVDRHLGRIRAGDQIRRADQVQKVLSRQPTAAFDHLVFHQSQMRGRTAEADRTQL